MSTFSASFAKRSSALARNSITATWNKTMTSCWVGAGTSSDGKRHWTQSLASQERHWGYSLATCPDSIFDSMKRQSFISSHFIFFKWKHQIVKRECSSRSCDFLLDFHLSSTLDRALGTLEWVSRFSRGSKAPARVMRCWGSNRSSNACARPWLIVKKLLFRFLTPQSHWLRNYSMSYCSLCLNCVLSVSPLSQQQLMTRSHDQRSIAFGWWCHPFFANYRSSRVHGRLRRRHEPSVITISHCKTSCITQHKKLANGFVFACLSRCFWAMCYSRAGHSHRAVFRRCAREPPIAGDDDVTSWCVRVGSKSTSSRLASIDLICL